MPGKHDPSGDGGKGKNEPRGPIADPNKNNGKGGKHSGDDKKGK